ncbi:hypothetical protein K501DRAFT_277251 [Backusella circina FSU 941]|nr:hypothetical protein K501DRAFT_277251 [Backusella circina FSU 941]
MISSSCAFKWTRVFESVSVRGKEQAMATRVKKAFKRTDHEGLLLMCIVNKNTNEPPKKVIDRHSNVEISLLSMLQYTICEHIRARDSTATNNIRTLGFLEWPGLERPAVFLRD